MMFEVPPSKSISNRALALALLTHPKIIRNFLECDDTNVVIDAYRRLGVDFEISGNDIFVNSGVRVGESPIELNLGNAGTAVRFLVPILCGIKGDYVVRGSVRMHERPLGDLIDALRELCAQITCLEKEGFLPIRIVGTTLSGSCRVKCDISSQFLSGLMIANAFRENPFQIEVSGECVSEPYIELTKDVIANFGRKEFFVEGDLSSASYFFALGAISKPITVTNVSRNSKQADLKFLDALTLMGCTVSYDNGITVNPPKEKLAGIGDYNCRDFPDSAMTLACLCAVASGRSRLTGLANLKFKECDRLIALETELRKIGCDVTAFDDGFEINGVPSESLKAADIETYNDHRIAMCVAVMRVLQPGINILNPQCVSKTFPGFWEAFPSL